MGAYLSEPVTEKMSTDEANEKLECGASSMQGWRVNQEDSHNTILDYDDNTSFFAVYDGHGGAEVATYCSQKLPDYIKETDAYKNGDFVNALTDAFLGFDATIATKEVMDILKELAGEINPPGPSDNEDSEDENEVLAKYENKLSTLHRARLGDTATPLSPCLRAKKNTEEINAASSASSSSGLSLAAGSSSEQICDAASSSKNGLLVSSNQGNENNTEEDTGGVSSTNSYEDKDLNGEVSTSEPEKTVKESVGKDADKINSTAPDSSGDNCRRPEQSQDVKSTTNAGNGPTSETFNGEVTDSKQVDGEDTNITSSNGSVTPVKSGKAKDKSSPVSSSDKVTPERPKKSKIRRAAAAVYESLLRQAAEDDDDESDSNDETFEGGEIDTSDEENVNGVEDSSNEDDGEEEDEDDYEAESSDEEGEEDISMSEEPGNDSGCTAIVALLKGNEVYVANAGDSRCIICRDGKAIDMSIDHKPEDTPELERITKAGGKVSYDGRINGGLNLSRAIGDHSYKQNKDLGPKEQMVTALPDVKTLTIDPAKDQFMVLACDGIWNFMSSQDVCDFILPRLTEGRERLSQICEEMFDHCLAPTTMGDGTGCDNMTAIIVRFKDGVISNVGQHSINTEGSKKRTAEDGPCDDNQQDTKRQKLDDSLSSSANSTVNVTKYIYELENV
ncbi:unnamed protein product, partial [Iphiclides podalirius]